MKFARTVTKKQKKEASKKRLGITLILVGLIAINVALVYTVFFEKPEPILSPLSKNQISSSDILENKIKESRIEYESLSTEKDSNYKIKLKSGGEIIIDHDKDIDKQLSSLQLILKQLKIEGKTLKRLDFRYQKPIIAF